MVRAAHPVHVTFRVRRHVWSLRSRRAFRVLHRAFTQGCHRFGTRLAHYAIMGNHLHLIVEAPSTRSLSRAMQGLAIRIAKGLNGLMGARGTVFEARYYATVLRTPRAVRAALAYVLNNYRRHAAAWRKRVTPGWLDPYSSAYAFDGWSGGPRPRMAALARGDPRRSSPRQEIARPTSNLLTCDWRLFGLVLVDEVPGPDARLS